MAVVLNQPLFSFHTRKALELKSYQVGALTVRKVFDPMQTQLASISGAAFSGLLQIN